MRAARRIPIGSIALLLGCGFGATAPALAAFDDPPMARTFSGENSNRDRIIDSVQKRYNARVVRVSETTVNGRAALELRLLSQQRVFNVVVDAASGQILSGG
ncbi:MAG: PepSY domain-containing protein [Steroidobacteraceae bacterium]